MLSERIRNCRPILELERAAYIALEVSPEEQEVLERISVERELRQFDYYGSSTSTLMKKLEVYLQNMGRNQLGDITRLAGMIVRISTGMREGFDAESAWTMVRVSLSNDDFEIPRWHPDGKYYNSPEAQYKLVATLKGAPTLFGEVIDRTRAEMLIRAMNDAPLDLELRKALAEIVRPIFLGEQPGVVVYRVGDKKAMFHSEPHIVKSRIFVSVLPGTKEQIRQWQMR